MRVIQITDCHVMVDRDAELKGIRTRARLERVMEQITLRHPTADRLVVTGDLTHDEQLATYESLAELWTPWRSRLRVLPGNHDDRQFMAQVFADQVERLHERVMFHEVVAGWRLLGLDSQRPGQVSGELGDTQREWLDKQLCADSGHPVCLFLHHPPISMNSLWLDEIRLQDGSELLQLVGRHPQIRLVVCGHVHQESAHLDGAAWVVTTPSTGVQFQPETAVLQVDSGANPGYRVLELSRAGRIRTWIERVTVEAGF